MTGEALSGRRIVVLGGTGGLGHAVTARFRDDGASVLVADAREPREGSRHEGVEYATVDVLDEASVAAAFATSPPPRAIVNLIGGYTAPQPLSGLDVSVLRQQLELNLVTAAIVTVGERGPGGTPARFWSDHGGHANRGTRRRVVGNDRRVLDGRTP